MLDREMVATYKKKKIPKAVREAVWVKHVGKKFEQKCLTHWCPNTMTVFDFQTSHNIPESKGGTMEIDNLFPLCGRCNLSMSSQYTYYEWSNIFKCKIPLWKRMYNCVFKSESKTTPASVFLNPSPNTTNHLGFAHDISRVV
jgi:hypothetical protein